MQITGDDVDEEKRCFISSVTPTRSSRNECAEANGMKESFTVGLELVA
jgi:hypothetical protein